MDRFCILIGCNVSLLNGYPQCWIQHQVIEAVQISHKESYERWIHPRNEKEWYAEKATIVAAGEVLSIWFWFGEITGYCDFGIFREMKRTDAAEKAIMVEAGEV